jgi:hypothetical protein
MGIYAKSWNFLQIIRKNLKITIKSYDKNMKDSKNYKNYLFRSYISKQTAKLIRNPSFPNKYNLFNPKLPPYNPN